MLFRNVLRRALKLQTWERARWVGAVIKCPFYQPACREKPNHQKLLAPIDLFDLADSKYGPVFDQSVLIHNLWTFHLISTYSVVIFFCTSFLLKFHSWSKKCKFYALWHHFKSRAKKSNLYFCHEIVFLFYLPTFGNYEFEFLIFRPLRNCILF